MIEKTALVLPYKDKYSNQRYMKMRKHLALLLCLLKKIMRHKSIKSQACYLNRRRFSKLIGSPILLAGYVIARAYKAEYSCNAADPLCLRFILDLLLGQITLNCVC